MKSLIALPLIVLISISALAANSVFRLDSPVPAELQTKILAKIAKDCPKITKGGLEEVETKVTIESPDQGIRDYIFETKLTYSYLFDGTHPVGYDIYVSSAKYDISNPSVDPLDVKSVSGLVSEICN